MNLNEKNIFLIDGLGALFSFISTGLVLPIFTNFTGLPVVLCYALATPALAFAIYSLSCYWLVKRIQPWMLGAIMTTNLSYSMIAILIVFAQHTSTFWARAYFVAEAFIIIGVVIFEAIVYRRTFRKS